MSNLKGVFAQNGVFSKLLVLVGISCFITIFGIIIWTLFSHGNTTDMLAMKFLQLIQSICMFVLPPFVFAYFCSERPKVFLHLDKKIKWMHLVYVVAFMILIIPAINLLTSLNQQMVLPRALVGLETWMKNSEAQLAQLTEQLLNIHGLSALAFNLFLIAMIPALGEELFFRGAVQGIFQQKINVKVAIWLAAFIFSAIHLQFYGFFPRLLLGAFFGYLLFWSDNLWLPIVAHFTNNGIAIVFYYLKYNGYKVPDIDTVGTGSTLWLGVVSVISALFGFLWLRGKLQKYSVIQAES